jgi:HEAT repeat protein
MIHAEPLHTTIRSLLAELESADPVQREVARFSLINIGTTEVTAALVAELLDPRQHVRWEAAKALCAVRDPISAPALLEALDDNDPDVRWVAGEGLIALGRTGLLAALHGLTKHARSPAFRKGAHHVLRDLYHQGESSAILAPVIAALEQGDPSITTPPTAYHALMALKVGS